MAGHTIAALTSSASGRAVARPKLSLFDLDAPAAGWQQLAIEGPDVYPGGAEVSCMGDRVMTVGSINTGVPVLRVYDTKTRSWTTPPAPPRPDDRDFQNGTFGSRVWTGSELLFINGEANYGAGVGERFELQPGWAYDLAANTWRTIPRYLATPVAPLWAGTAAVAYAVPFGGVVSADATRLRTSTTQQAVRYTPR